MYGGNLGYNERMTRKERTWYIGVASAVLIVMASEGYGWSVIVFGPVLLGMVWLGYWLFGVK
jgi:hypothetical protein